MSKEQTLSKQMNHTNEIVRSDINLEKWSIFATRGSKGYRVLKREFLLPNGSRIHQSVKIGLPGSMHTLTADLAKLFYVLLDLWYKSGRNPDGIVTASFREVYISFLGKKSQNLRYGTWQKLYLKSKLDELRTIPISFENSYHDKSSGQYHDKSFTLLTEVNLFERKRRSKGKQVYFESSTFVINKEVIASILNRQVKPILLNVITKLKSEIAIILYRHLDLILADKVQIELRLDKLQQEFNFGATRPDNYLRQMREACMELQGCDITTGRLSYCAIERTVDGRAWKLVVKKGKQLFISETAVKADVQITEDQMETEIAAAQAFLSALSETEQEELELLREKVIKEKFKSMGGDLTFNLALIDAILTFKSSKRSLEVDAIAV